MADAKWREGTAGFFNGADAQKVADEIDLIQRDEDGNLKSQQIVDAARDSNSELHKCFEFDDAVAGEKYRLIQARDIIRHFVIKHTNDKGEEQNIRTFQITTVTNHYEPTRVIMKNPDEYAALLARAKEELRYIKRRYETLTELEEVFEAIDAL